MVQDESRGVTTCDILLRDGWILGGSGTPPRQGDLAVSGDRIVAVGRLDRLRAGRVVDCHGLHLTPGFIDAHSHAANGLTKKELSHALPLIKQGITTVVINPDGFGPVDLVAQRAALQAHGVGVNTVQLVPHGAIRQHVLGHADRPATDDELEKMKRLVRTGMASGAFGLSSGLFYSPACFAPTGELIALGRIAAEFGGVHSCHLRDESNYSIGITAAVDELIDISRQANLPGIITHIKALGPNAWGLSEGLVRRVDAARAAGLHIWADQYPYNASSTYLSSALIPKWALEGGRHAMVHRFEDRRSKQRLAADIGQNLDRRGGPARITVHSYAPAPQLEGQSLHDIAESRDSDPVELIIDLLIRGEAGIVSHAMSERDVAHFMRQPWTMVCTDGHLPPFNSGSPHPRCYGAFPRRIAKYVIEERVTTLEHAIRAMTALPAQVFRIQNRGALQTGAFADIVALDLDRFRDRATFGNPHQYAEGVVHLLINGKFAIENGKPKDAWCGRILTRT